MHAAYSLDGLMKWAGRAEWNDAFAALFGRHVSSACAGAGVAVEDLPALVGAHWVGILWGCAFEDFLTRELEDGRNVADDYLKRRGWKESAPTRAYIAALRSARMSLYEVSGIVAGESFLARDLVRGGEPVRVSERSATRSLRQWDRIGARVVSVAGRTMITGGVLPFDREASEELLGMLRRATEKAGEEAAKLAQSAGRAPDDPAVTGALGLDTVLELSAFMFSNVWLRVVLDKALNPKLPQICNADGEPLEFVTLRYPLPPGTSHDAVRAALMPIAALRQENERFWNWVEERPARKKPARRAPGVRSLVTTMDDGASVLGEIALEGEALTLSVNSRPRAERGRALLEPALAGLVGEPAIETRSVEQMMASPPAEGQPAARPGRPAGLTPEAERAIIHQTLDEHYARTIKERIPMLGDVSPIQAVRTEKGREKVVAWLKMLENHSAGLPPGDPMADYDFAWLWEKLGLADRRR